LGLLFFCGSLLVSNFNDVLFKLLGERLPSTEITFLRFFFSTLMLGVYILFTRTSIKSSRLHIHLLRGALLFAGMAIWCLGLSLVPLTDAIVINFTIPIFTLILARVILKERFDRQRWLATLIGFAGVIFVTRPTSADFDPDCLLLLISAALFSSCDILNKIYVHKESTISMLFYTALFTSLIGAFPAALNWVNPTSFELMITFGLGFGANAILYLILKAFERVEASATAPFRYLELILSAISGYVFFTEIPKVSTWIGAFLIIPATIGLVLHESKKERIAEKLD
jgi:S-adenosylmethionine uptake transporter